MEEQGLAYEFAAALFHYWWLVVVGFFLAGVGIYKRVREVQPWFSLNAWMWWGIAALLLANFMAFADMRDQRNTFRDMAPKRMTDEELARLAARTAEEVRGFLRFERQNEPPHDRRLDRFPSQLLRDDAYNRWHQGVMQHAEKLLRFRCSAIVTLAIDRGFVEMFQWQFMTFT